MITVTDDKVKIEGKGVELLGELSSVVRAMHRNFSKTSDKKSSEDLIREAVDFGLKDPKDVKKEIAELLMKIMEEDADE